MANSNFIVQNGLTVGPTTIFAGNGDIILSGNITTTGTGSINSTTGLLNPASIYSGASNVSVTATNIFANIAGTNTVNVSANNVAIPFQIVSNSIVSNTGTLSVGGNINYGPDYGLVASFVANNPGYAYAAIQNLNTGGNASASFTAYNNTGTSYIDVGVNSSNFNATSSGFVNNSLNTPNASYAYAYGGDMVVGTWNNNGIHFITNAASTVGDSMFIAGNGNVYISGNLTVSGNTAFTYTTTNFVTESANVVQTAYLSGNASTNSGTITLTNNLIPNGTSVTLGSSGSPFGNIYGTLQTAAQTNITSVGTLTGLTSGTILPSGNLTVNLGSTTAWFNNIYGNTFVGTSTSARYADLAENYQADQFYMPGTVVQFGGVAEVTRAEVDTTRVAGVISTNPATLMNAALNGANVVAVALIGRVPCMVIGPVAKGDIMVSAGFGYARVNNTPAPGQAIGKALEDFVSQAKGVIEVVVGKI
jgi:hypothetical protein